MSHKSALQLLTPLDLGGVHDIDLTVEALQLDGAVDDLETLRQSIITDTAEVIPSNNRIHLTPIRGDIKKPYFVTLAATMGYTIQIDDYTENMVEWTCVGDTITANPWHYFEAGIAMSGDYLAQENVILPWIWDVVVLTVPDTIPVPSLETVIDNLTPAHFHINFIYPG